MAGLDDLSKVFSEGRRTPVPEEKRVEYVSDEIRDIKSILQLAYSLEEKDVTDDVIGDSVAWFGFDNSRKKLAKLVKEFEAKPSSVDASQIFSERDKLRSFINDLIRRPEPSSLSSLNTGDTPAMQYDVVTMNPKTFNEKYGTHTAEALTRTASGSERGAAETHTVAKEKEALTVEFPDINKQLHWGVTEQKDYEKAALQAHARLKSRQKLLSQQIDTLNTEGGNGEQLQKIDASIEEIRQLAKQINEAIKKSTETVTDEVLSPTHASEPNSNKQTLEKQEQQFVTAEYLQRQEEVDAFQRANQKVSAASENATAAKSAGSTASGRAERKVAQPDVDVKSKDSAKTPAVPASKTPDGVPDGSSKFRMVVTPKEMYDELGEAALDPIRDSELLNTNTLTTLEEQYGVEYLSQFPQYLNAKNQFAKLESLQKSGGWGEKPELAKHLLQTTEQNARTLLKNLIDAVKVTQKKADIPTSNPAHDKTGENKLEPLVLTPDQRVDDDAPTLPSGQVPDKDGVQKLEPLVLTPDQRVDDDAPTLSSNAIPASPLPGLDREGVRTEWLAARNEAKAASEKFNQAYQEYYQSLHNNKWKSAYQSAKTFGKDLFGIRPQLTPELQALQQKDLAAQRDFAIMAKEMQKFPGVAEEKQNERWDRFLAKKTADYEKDGKSLPTKNELRAQFYEREAMLDKRYLKQLDYAIAINRMKERHLAQEKAIADSPKIKSLEAMKSIMAGKRGVALRVGIYGTVGAITGGMSGAIGAAAGVAGAIGGGFATRFGYEKTLTQRARNAEQNEFAKLVNSLDSTQLEQRRAEVLEAMARVRSSERRKDAAALAGAAFGGGLAGAAAESYMSMETPTQAPTIPGDVVDTPVAPTPEPAPEPMSPALPEVSPEIPPEPEPEVSPEVPPETVPNPDPSEAPATETESTPEPTEEPAPAPESESIPTIDFESLLYTVEPGDRGLTYVLQELYPDLFPRVGSLEWLAFVDAIENNTQLLAEAGFPNADVNDIFPGNQFRADVFAEFYVNEMLGEAARATYIAAHPELTTVAVATDMTSATANVPAESLRPELRPNDLTATENAPTESVRPELRPETQTAPITNEPRTPLQGIDEPDYGANRTEGVLVNDEQGPEALRGPDGAATEFGEFAVRAAIEAAQQRYAEVALQLQDRFDIYSADLANYINQQVSDWAATQEGLEAADVEARATSLYLRELLPVLLPDGSDVEMMKGALDTLWDEPLRDYAAGASTVQIEAVQAMQQRLNEMGAMPFSSFNGTVGEYLGALYQSTGANPEQFQSVLQDLKANQ